MPLVLVFSSMRKIRLKSIRAIAIITTLVWPVGSRSEVLSQKTAVRPSLTVNLSNDATFLEGSKGEFAVRTPLELGFIDDSTLILSYDNRTNFEEDPALRNTYRALGFRR